MIWSVYITGVLALKGKIFTGQGNGRKFVSLEWVRDQIAEQLGFVPFAGTLDLRIPEDSSVVERLMGSSRFWIVPTQGFFSGELFKATIRGVECGLVIPGTPEYPKNMIEIIAACNLRELLGLRDGETVEVEIQTP